MFLGEIERQRRRDGGGYSYRWRGERKGRIFLILDALISMYMLISN